MAAIRSFENQLFKVASEKRLWLLPLGQVDNETIWLVKSRMDLEQPDPKMLIISGFHGEEQAGPWAILKWLQTCDVSVFDKIYLSFIPIVNPVGFKKNQRYSIPGERNNQGFCHPERNEKRSREGDILVKNMDVLLPLAKNGYLSLHEDVSVKEYYIYTFERKPGPFTRSMLGALSKHFPKALTGQTTDGLTPEEVISRNEIETPVVNGWVNHRRLHDGSFEDFMFHANVPRVVVTETPGTYILKRRVAAGMDAISTYIDYGLKAIRKEKKEKQIA